MYNLNMSKIKDLTGWNYIVFQLILNHFKSNEFTITELYKFERDFQSIYPANFHIKDKIRQILQNLRNQSYILFLGNGNYVLQSKSFISKVDPHTNEPNYVYLLSNSSLPDWVKIGRTNNLDRRLKELYNTSIPTPFKLEESIKTNNLQKAKIVEKSIHTLIDNLNPLLRKETEAKNREFFKISISLGKDLFSLASKIINQ
jgi:hypothetical protein